MFCQVLTRRFCLEVCAVYLIAKICRFQRHCSAGCTYSREREFYFGSIDFGGYVSFLLYFLPAFFEWECTEMNAKEECKLSVYGRIWENRLSACPTNVFQQSGFNCFLGRKLIQTVLWAHSVGSRGG